MTESSIVITPVCTSFSGIVLLRWILLGFPIRSLSPTPHLLYTTHRLLALCVQSSDYQMWLGLVSEQFCSEQSLNLLLMFVTVATAMQCLHLHTGWPKKMVLSVFEIKSVLDVGFDFSACVLESEFRAQFITIPIQKKICLKNAKNASEDHYFPLAIWSEAETLSSSQMHSSAAQTQDLQGTECDQFQRGQYWWLNTFSPFWKW